MTAKDANDFSNKLFSLCREYGVWYKSSKTTFDNNRPNSPYTTIIELSVKVNGKSENSGEELVE